MSFHTLTVTPFNSIPIYLFFILFHFFALQIQNKNHSPLLSSSVEDNKAPLSNPTAATPEPQNSETEMTQNTHIALPPPPAPELPELTHELQREYYCDNCKMWLPMKPSLDGQNNSHKRERVVPVNAFEAVQSENGGYEGYRSFYLTPSLRTVSPVVENGVSGRRIGSVILEHPAKIPRLLMWVEKGFSSSDFQNLPPAAAAVAAGSSSGGGTQPNVPGNYYGSAWTNFVPPPPPPNQANHEWKIDDGDAAEEDEENDELDLTLRL